jgi:ketosteroid isomerase-like protein
MKKMILVLAVLFLASCSTGSDTDARRLVEEHAKAWETGNKELLESVIHKDIVFAYPGRRLNRQQTIEDFDYFSKNFNETKVYINKVIVEGNNVAVEWQFATTNIATGKRQVVSDAIIAEIRDGKFVVWKEYLDGRVKLLQETGELFMEEGEEPYPWPLKTESYGKKVS